MFFFFLKKKKGVGPFNNKKNKRLRIPHAKLATSGLDFVADFSFSLFLFIFFYISIFFYIHLF